VVQSYINVKPAKCKAHIKYFALSISLGKHYDSINMQYKTFVKIKKWPENIDTFARQEFLSHSAPE